MKSWFPGFLIKLFWLRLAQRCVFALISTSVKQFDYLVLGSGIAGLTFALQVAPRGRVAIVTKKDRAESNTNYAQGGIASVTSKEDTFELHVRDTLAAGAGLCKENIVRTIVEEGPECIQELIELGMKFSEREALSEDSAAKAATRNEEFCTPKMSPDVRLSAPCSTRFPSSRTSRFLRITSRLI
jgi:succinate dehydrogenase/fumarate reductase flavoprotein subunit